MTTTPTRPRRTAAHSGTGCAVRPEPGRTAHPRAVRASRPEGNLRLQIGGRPQGAVHVERCRPVLVDDPPLAVQTPQPERRAEPERERLRGTGLGPHALQAGAQREVTV